MSIVPSAIRQLFPMPAGRVSETCAEEAADLEHAVRFRLNTPMARGIRNFVDWFQGNHPTSAVDERRLEPIDID
jgi:hypothetical protein